MRYELRLAAYDMLDQIMIKLDVDCTPDDPDLPTERVLAMTATTRSRGLTEAKEWTREVLDTMLAGL